MHLYMHLYTFRSWICTLHDMHMLHMRLHMRLHKRVHVRVHMQMHMRMRIIACIMTRLTQV